MGRDRNVLSMVKSAGREGRQHRIGGVVFNAHDSSLSRLRSRLMAKRSLDLTVPSGIPRICAISACAFSSKNDNSTTRIWSADKFESAATDPLF